MGRLKVTVLRISMVMGLTVAAPWSAQADRGDRIDRGRDHQRDCTATCWAFDLDGTYFSGRDYGPRGFCSKDRAAMRAMRKCQERSIHPRSCRVSLAQCRVY